MKSSEFKQLIKEAVKEVFREEMKEILLEAIRSPKKIVTESQPNIGDYRYSGVNSGSPIPPNPVITSTSEFKQNLREQYMNILGETAMSFNTSNVPFNPIGADTINGELPAGEVSLGQISNLLNPK